MLEAGLTVSQRLEPDEKPSSFAELAIVKVPLRMGESPPDR